MHVEAIKIINKAIAVPDWFKINRIYFTVKWAIQLQIKEIMIVQPGDTWELPI